MIFDGLLLTVIGMGVVFLFLILLIFSMDALARAVQVLDARFPPKSEPAPALDHDDSEIAAAIVIARTFTQKP